MQIKTLKNKFKETFGLTLRVYDGRSFADENKTVASIRKKQGSGELSIRKNMLVGNLEEKIMEMFGVKTQISGSDDSYLCDNNLSLSKALKKDNVKLSRKNRKSETTGEVKTETEADTQISTGEDATVSNKSELEEIIENDCVMDFLEGMENKIMETGMLTGLVGISSFDIALNLEAYQGDSDVRLKLVIDIGHEENNFSVIDDQVEEISDTVRDYCSEKGLFDMLEEQGVEEADEVLDWCPVTFNDEIPKLD